jgi:hypothetical protein
MRPKDGHSIIRKAYGPPREYPQTTHTWWMDAPREQFTQVCVEKIPYYLRSPRGHDKYVAIFAERLPASRPSKSRAEVDQV